MHRNIFLAAVLLAACSKGAGTSSLSLGARNRTATAAAAAAATPAPIVLTRARIALQKIELRTRTGDKRAEISVGPVVIGLTAAELDGKVHRVLDSTVPAGTYDKIEFEIAPLQQTIADPAAADLVSQHASAIIEGTFNDASFTFVTTLDAQQELEGNFTVTDKSSNVTFDVDTSAWFVKNGAVLDPRDPANKSAIEDNLRRSINAFQDDDELGHENHDVNDDNGGDADGGPDDGPGEH
jgi:hypothetical protein